MSRCGTANGHCCWFQGIECQFVQRRDGEYKWRCALRARMASWDEVHQSSQYLLFVRPKMARAGYKEDCGDWPPPGIKCNECGEGG